MSLTESKFSKKFVMQGNFSNDQTNIKHVILIILTILNIQLMGTHSNSTNINSDVHTKRSPFQLSFCGRVRQINQNILQKPTIIRSDESSCLNYKIELFHRHF